MNTAELAGYRGNDNYNCLGNYDKGGWGGNGRITAKPLVNGNYNCWN